MFIVRQISEKVVGVKDGSNAELLTTARLAAFQQHQDRDIVVIFDNAADVYYSVRAGNLRVIALDGGVAEPAAVEDCILALSALPNFSTAGGSASTTPPVDLSGYQQTSEKASSIPVGAALQLPSTYYPTVDAVKNYLANYYQQTGQRVDMITAAGTSNDYASVPAIRDYVTAQLAALPPSAQELPFTAYNNSEQPSNKWAKLAEIRVDIDSGRFWNSHFIKFDFAVTSRKLISDLSNEMINYPQQEDGRFYIVGTALCNIRHPADGQNSSSTKLNYLLGSLADVPFANMYCGLRSGTEFFTWELWFHNCKPAGEDGNSTFLKINGIEVIGTEIENYSQIHVTTYNQQMVDSPDNPSGTMMVFKPIVNY